MTDRARTSTGNRYLPLVAALCRAHGWPVPVAEHRFHETRRWRFDLAWPDRKLAVEINGGVFVQGRHARGAGLLGDYEKLNAAQIAGWTCLQTTPRGVTDGDLSTWLAQAFTQEATR